MEGEMHNAKIQRLLDENLRLIIERDISLYELGIAREELRRKDLMIHDIRVEHEFHCRQLMERGLKLIEEIPVVGPLKKEVKHLQSEVKKLCFVKQDLSSEVETVTKDLTRLQAQNKQIPFLRDEINRLRHHIVQSTGKKMVAFCSKILQQLDHGLVHCQVLLLASTCERAHQIEKLMQDLGGELGVKIHACAGDNSIKEDKHILSAGVHLVVGTPWRVLNLLCAQNQYLHPDHIRMLVLDEADEMLSGGFDDQIHNILPLLPAKVEVVALYATMPEDDPLEVTRKLMNKPEGTNLWQSIVF